MDTIANTENKVSIYANNMMPKSRDSYNNYSRDTNSITYTKKGESHGEN